MGAGLSLQKLAPAVDQKKAKEFSSIIEKYYDTSRVKNANDTGFLDFYRAVCEIIEKLNAELGNTQIKLPKEEDLRKEFDRMQNGKKDDSGLTKEEFQDIMKNLVKESGFTGIGAKEIILYIFGVPLTALLIKQRVMPEAVPDEVFIPGVTSVTVFALAALNKI